MKQSKCEFGIFQIFEDKITNIKYKLKKVIDWWLTDWFFSIFSKPTELFKGCSREKILVSKVDANKMKVNEAFIAEWLKHESLWDIKAKAYKDRIGRENDLRIILNYFYIAKASPKQFLFFFFVQCFFSWNYRNGSFYSCKFLAHCTLSWNRDQRV